MRELHAAPSSSLRVPTTGYLLVKCLYHPANAVRSASLKSYTLQALAEACPMDSSSITCCTDQEQRVLKDFYMHVCSSYSL
eukprot:1323381-Amphidinium_carterae.1